jgi:hypothetical protein
MLRALVLVLVMLLPARAAAGEERKATILARAFAYDYSLKGRAGKSVSLAVLFKAGTPASETAADAWVKAFKSLEGVTMQGLPFSTSKVPWEGADRLRARIASDGVDIVFVCDGLEPDVGAIREVSREKKVLTVTDREALVLQGVTLGVYAEGDKLTITINLPAATGEGVSFSSELLRLAKVIR